MLHILESGSCREITCQSQYYAAKLETFAGKHSSNHNRMLAQTHAVNFHLTCHN